ncbi:hypothetical protein [Pseudarthrobacter enclensis]|uniref:hypothetical protein n=1 Tax=Pseudarthrobacter enclensis TaxID=993070 RepID=UPI003EDF5822
MEPERTDAATTGNTHSLTRDQQVNIKFSSWASSVAMLLVMVPTFYRLANHESSWWDAVFLTIGAGLITFHMSRLVRLRRSQRKGVQ